MVSTTRAEAKESFNKVLDKVLDRGDSSSLKRALIEDGITDIFGLVTILDEVIDSLAYEDPDDKIFNPVKKGDKMLLRCFLAYHKSLESVTGDVDYNAITQANFDSYRISPAYRSILYQPDTTFSSPAPTTPLPTTSSQPFHFSPVAMFRCTIKKDPSLFPTL
jgi:CRISPR/Cas system CSM-associated protein Csm2 small subunit